MKERFLGESFLRPTYGHYYSTGHYDDYERLPTIPELHRAARDGDTSAIKRLIDNGDNINGITYNGRTALHYATANQNLNAVNLLINLGADIAVTDLSGRVARDLIIQPGLQLNFDSFVINLQQHNIEVRATALFRASEEANLPSLPMEICRYIAEIEGGTGARLEHIDEQPNHSSFCEFPSACLTACFAKIFCCFDDCFE